MPIQVVSTYKKIPPPPVTLVTAGTDLFPLCATQVFLQATVIPLSNIQGHTIIWEQLTGTPVILINADTLAPSYLRIVNDQTDKKFKITIDINLPDEQTDTLIVYATPTSVVSSAYIITPNPHTPFDTVDIINASVGAELVPPPSGINDDVTPLGTFVLTWDVPPDLVLDPFLIDMTLYENYAPIGTYLPTDTLEYFGNPGIYYITTEYLVNQQPSTGRGKTNNFTNIQIPVLRIIDDVVDNIQISPPDTTIIKFSNNRQDEMDTLGTTNYQSKDAALVARFINIDANGTDSQSANLSASNATILRTDPGGIGGG